MTRVLNLVDKNSLNLKGVYYLHETVYSGIEFVGQVPFCKGCNKILVFSSNITCNCENSKKGTYKYPISEVKETPSTKSKYKNRKKG